MPKKKAPTHKFITKSLPINTDWELPTEVLDDESIDILAPSEEDSE